LLKSNPSLYVSRTRLSIRQLPQNVTEHMLKRLANYAIREFEEEVKKKVRIPLDPEEVQNASEEQKPTKKRKILEKVKQAKIVRQQDRVDPITGKGKSRGYGFLELHDHADALRVLRWANNNTDLAQLWAKWRKEEIGTLIEQAQRSVKSADKDGDNDTPDPRLQRLKDELNKDASGRWTTKGSLIVEFSLENIQVTQRRKLRETGVGHTGHHRDKTQVKTEERPFKKRKVQPVQAQITDDGRTGGVATKQKTITSSVVERPKQLGFMIGRKRRQKKTRS